MRSSQCKGGPEAPWRAKSRKENGQFPIQEIMMLFGRSAEAREGGDESESEIGRTPAQENEFCKRMI